MRTEFDPSGEGRLRLWVATDFDSLEVGLNRFSHVLHALD